MMDNPHNDRIDAAAEQAVAQRLFTARVPHPARRTAKRYLRLFRKILAHPRVYSIFMHPEGPIEVGYHAHALNQDLDERLAQEIAADEVFNRVKVLPVHLPLFEGLVHMQVAAERQGLVPCKVFVASEDVLKPLGWSQGDTFMQATIEEMASLPQSLVVFGLAPDNVCDNADIQQLWSLQLEESGERAVPASDPVPASSE